MMIVRFYTLFDQLEVAAQSTRLTVINPSGKLIMPALEHVSQPIDREHAPQDLVAAVCQLVDNIEHGPLKPLWDHLER